jgi:signal transduction histidine kinase
MERSMLQGLAVFRWGAWLWMAAVLGVSRGDLARPWLAVILAALALAVTVVDTALLRSDHPALLRPGPVLGELAVGAALLLADGWAYGPDHAFSNSQSLGSVWPLAGILATGLAFGPLRAGLAGVAFGLARTGAVLANGEAIDSGGEVLSLASTAVFYALGGAVAGYVARFLRGAEQEISAARAREEVARTLHDGVLQTLALFERRVDDPELARLAREQDRDLREYLFGTARSLPGGGDLGAAVRAAAARWERSYGGRVDVVVADDLPDLADGACEAVAGAVGEALTNAGKHGGASRVTVYLEPAEQGGVFCSVKDDGAGFDPATTVARVGLDRSIRGRVAEVGGRVDVQSRPGEGAEVCLWVPSR